MKDCDISSSSGELAERYEELRHNKLAGQGQSQNLGLAMFCHRGMAVWMNAWSNYISDIPAEKPVEKSLSPKSVAIPTATQNNLITVLVSMIFSNRRAIRL